VDKTEEKIREILEGLECILSVHDSCAELVEVKDNRAIINCVGPCLHCDNRCIEEAIKEKLPDIEVIIR
jgi:flavoprotein